MSRHFFFFDAVVFKTGYSTFLFNKSRSIEKENKSVNEREMRNKKRFKSNCFAKRKHQYINRLIYRKQIDLCHSKKEKKKFPLTYYKQYHLPKQKKNKYVQSPAHLDESPHRAQKSIRYFVVYSRRRTCDFIEEEAVLYRTIYAVRKAYTWPYTASHYHRRRRAFVYTYIFWPIYPLTF